MNLLVETYVFYADVYFFQNLLIKCSVLYFSLYVNKIHNSVLNVRGILKIVIVAAFGTMIELFGLGFFHSYNLFIVLVHIFEIPLLVCMLVEKNTRMYGKVIIAGYFFVIVVNGVLEILWNMFGKYEKYIWLLSASCFSVYIALSIWMNYLRLHKGIFQVEIRHGEKRLMTYGLYDSGNRLKDTYTKKGVHIISPSVIAELLSERDVPVYIPYHALGNEQGLIQVYYLDYIRIYREETIIEHEKVPVGIAENALFQQKNYQMILNEEIW